MTSFSRLLGWLILLQPHLATSLNASPVEVFGQLPLYQQVKISPDGERIAYLQKVDEKYVLVNRDLAGKGEPLAYGLAEGSLRDFQWVADDRILVRMTTSYYSKGDMQQFTLSRTGILKARSNEMIWPFGASRFVNFIHGPWLHHRLPENSEHILMTAFSTHQGEIQTGSRIKRESTVTRRGLYRVDLNSGDIELLESSEDTGTQWLVNRAGQVLMKYQFHGQSGKQIWWHRRHIDDDFQPLLIAADDAQLPFNGNIIGTSEDLSEVYYQASGAEGRGQVNRAGIGDDSLMALEVVERDETFDVHEVQTDLHSGAVVGTVHLEDRPEYRYFDRDFKQVQADLEATFPGASAAIDTYSRDFNKLVVAVSGPETPYSYLLYDRNAGSISELARAYPGLTAAMLSPVQRFDYAARDGLQIQAYLTLPGGTDADKPPLVVLPHGGPNTRDDAEFDWLRQFYASRGYAVFQPNFRGSSGYGAKFQEAGLREWGGKMQSDLDDGVEALIAAGHIDADRICAVGVSYGGYAALMAVITRPDLYRCAATFGAVTNLSSMFTHVREQKQSVDYWVESIGSHFEEEFLRSRSPAYLAGRLTPPVLLYHGENDTVVPQGQSYQMSRRLKKAGNDHVLYKILDNEDHWFTLERSRKTFLRDSADFIDRYIDG